jgi:hypothetical protein
LAVVPQAAEAATVVDRALVESAAEGKEAAVKAEVVAAVTAPADSAQAVDDRDGRS